MSKKFRGAAGLREICCEFDQIRMLRKKSMTKMNNVLTDQERVQSRRFLRLVINLLVTAIV